jgi:hypothetical protein
VRQYGATHSNAEAQEIYRQKVAGSFRLKANRSALKGTQREAEFYEALW